MDLSNLKMSFMIVGDNVPVTIYQFGKNYHELSIAYEEEYALVYKDSSGIKISITTDNLPQLLRIQIKNLYNGFGIDKNEIQSCIWNIYGYLKRTKKD